MEYNGVKYDPDNPRLIIDEVFRNETVLGYSTFSKPRGFMEVFKYYALVAVAYFIVAYFLGGLMFGIQVFDWGNSITLSYMSVVAFLNSLLLLVGAIHGLIERHNFSQRTIQYHLYNLYPDLVEEMLSENYNQRLRMLSERSKEESKKALSAI